jgi:hypothetical protein
LRWVAHVSEIVFGAEMTFANIADVVVLHMLPVLSVFAVPDNATAACV